MTDEQIIKALEWHSNNETHCSACPYEEHSITHYCIDMVIEDALDLINRQKAEIERLKYSAELWEGDAKHLFRSRENIKAEAIKEFAERLKDSLCKSIGPSRKLYWKISADIDNLVKEMVGEG